MPVGCLQIYQIENDIDIDINVYLPITWERNQTYQLSGSTKKPKQRYQSHGMFVNCINIAVNELNRCNATQYNNYDIVNIARRFATIWMINMYCWNKYY